MGNNYVIEGDEFPSPRYGATGPLRFQFTDKGFAELHRRLINIFGVETQVAPDIRISSFLPEGSSQQAELEKGSAQQQSQMEIEKLKGTNDARVAEINAESRIRTAEISADASRDIADAKHETELDKKVIEAQQKEEPAKANESKSDKQADKMGKEAAIEMLDK